MVTAPTPVPDVVSAQGLTGCVEDGGACGQKIVGRGRCRKHYVRWWRRTRGAEVAPALGLKTKTPHERFWDKVGIGSASECWPWGGSADDKGYGEFYVSPERGTVPAHAYAVEVATGQQCPNGLEACHRCDNPPCCNPDHLYYGTRQQNVNDMWSRLRAPRGSARTQAKLNESAVLSIRTRFAAGELSTHLAAEYGIADSLVSRIVNGRAWHHVGGPTGTHGKPGRRPLNRKVV
ncbi:HNH endonuclease signature motif containing protein [Micromonospora sp. NPDC006766]|uniref:HNH endonuclease signature motif containing protein n=1 Tax=Micromonospora sp. NPDC006766 TaxID=3154778 RepID=UPI0033D33A9B